MIVRGGSLVTPEGLVQADLAVEDGRISAMGPELPGAAVEIDARGLTILPGLIDVHVHFNEPGRAEWEGAATGSRALAAGGGTVFFDMPLNVSSGRGVAAALEARARGVDISIETCPHYLYFTEEDMVRMGAVAKCAPPLRTAGERDALWAAVLRGDVDMVGSDHSPAPLEMKRHEDFFRAWGGVAGVQSTLAVLLSGPVPSGTDDRLLSSVSAPSAETPGTGPHTGSLGGPRGYPNTSVCATKIAALTAANPARRFGIANKGKLAVGFDADFTLVDLGARYTVTRESLFQRHGLSPYLGATFRGVVRRTVLRGQTIFADGKIVGEARGRMIAHATTGTHA